MRSAGLLVHLVAFAAYLGAGFAQLQMTKRSRDGSLAAAVRDEYERLAAAIVTKIELPALMLAIASGVYFLLIFPGYMRQGWMHGKLTCVALLAILSHLEMFNARKIVRARAANAETMEVEILARKKRHAIYGGLGSAVALVLLVMVTLIRLGFS